MASTKTDDKDPSSPLYQADYGRGVADGYEAARTHNLRKYTYFLSITSNGKESMEMSPYMKGFFDGFAQYRIEYTPR